MAFHRGTEACNAWALLLCSFRRNTKTFIAIIAIALSVGIGLSTSVSAKGPAQAPAVQKWEYMVVDPDDKGGDGERRERLQAQLIPLGQEGWEMVEMPYLKGVRYQVVVLKRPIP